MKYDIIRAKIILTLLSFFRKFIFLHFLVVFIVSVKDILNGNKIKEKIFSVISRYSSDISKVHKEKIYNDIFKCCVVNYIKPYEYFWYGFAAKTYEQRSEFISEREEKCLQRIINIDSPWKIFCDKEQTYNFFKPFFCRRMIKIKNKDDKDFFLRFISASNKFIIKPVNLQGGKGVILLDDIKRAEEVFDTKISKILIDGNVIVEDYINQDEIMARLNPSSVNTVRISTFVDGDKIIKLFACLRIGRKGAIIDNASSGGMVASIDLKTGIVATGGRNEKLEYFKRHPDTGEQILGFQIPKWNDLLKLTDKLAMVLPAQKHVGWDLALTNKGWVLVEGNSKLPQLLSQLSEQKGLRKIFNETFYKYI